MIRRLKNNNFSRRARFRDTMESHKIPWQDNEKTEYSFPPCGEKELAKIRGELKSGVRRKKISSIVLVFGICVFLFIAYYFFVIKSDLIQM
jgi:hypothetical protein